MEASERPGVSDPRAAESPAPPEFVRAWIELGQRDANALLNGVPTNEVPWSVS